MLHAWDGGTTKQNSILTQYPSLSLSVDCQQTVFLFRLKIVTAYDIATWRYLEALAKVGFLQDLLMQEKHSQGPNPKLPFLHFPHSYGLI